MVLKNLADPVKVHEPKYRLLRLDNEKIKAKILPCPASLNFLKAIGFVETTDEEGLRILKLEGIVNTSLMEASLQEVSAGLKMVVPNDFPISIKKARTTYGDAIKEDFLAPVITFPEKITEKQKARSLKEEKEKEEKEEAKRHRAKVAALIKTDKYVRENDENWTSGVSAAAAKGGKVMPTFRDQFGEE